MKLKIKWYRIVRTLLPAAYALLLVKGYMSKDFTFMAILLGSTLLGGAWFCGWLCPFGFAQEWLGKLGRLLRIPRLRIPQKAVLWVNLLRYILFGLSFLGIAVVLLAQSPYGSFMGIVDRNMGYITKTAWALLGVFLGLSLFVDRPFCRFICPEGARYGILSLARIFTIRKDTEKCVSCKKCDAACPAQIEVSRHPVVRNAQCVNCMECLAACPVKGTLSFGWAFNNSTQRKRED